MKQICDQTSQFSWTVAMNVANSVNGEAEYIKIMSQSRQIRYANPIDILRITTLIITLTFQTLLNENKLLKRNRNTPHKPSKRYNQNNNYKMFVFVK